MELAVAQILLPSVAYFRWYSGVARRFLSVERALNDPRVAELPADAPVDTPPAPFVNDQIMFLARVVDNVGDVVGLALGVVESWIVMRRRMMTT